MFNFLKNLFGGEPLESPQSQKHLIGAKGMTQHFKTSDPSIPKFTIPRHLIFTLIWRLASRKTFTYADLLSWVQFDPSVNANDMKSRLLTAMARLEKKKLIKKIAKNKWKLLI